MIRQGIRAGVKIRAITGDSRETITGLGLEAKLLSTEELDDPYVCMTGLELVEACKLEKITDELELKGAIARLNERKRRIVDRLQILCRSSPKYLEYFIRLLKEHSRIVAATGSKS